MSEVDIIKKPIDCPHCKGKIDVEIEKPRAKVILKEENTEVIKEKTVDVHDHSHSENPKPDEHQEIANKMPKGMNFAYCTGPDCGKKITNAKGITTKFKTCINCKANTVPKSKKYCPTCGMKEDEDNAFEDSEVELEVEEDE